MRYSQQWLGYVCHYTQSCGILDKLLPGDVVSADRGLFDVSESVGTMQARVHIPAFTRVKASYQQLKLKVQGLLLIYMYMQNMLLELCSRNIIIEGNFTHKVCIKNNKESSHVDNILCVCVCCVMHVTFRLIYSVIVICK